MKLDRRSLLGLLGAGATTACATTPSATQAGPVAFLHGVASGDPLADRVILVNNASLAGHCHLDDDVIIGGLSGVLYGLLGHCWIYQRLAPNAAYRLPPGVLVMMLAWLLICMTGIFELLQFGAIANAAHVGGLLTGCLTGLLGGMLARR